MCAVCWNGAQVLPVAAVTARFWYASRMNRADRIADHDDEAGGAGSGGPSPGGRELADADA